MNQTHTDVGYTIITRLNPIIHTLMALGISHDQFSELAKKSYIEMAKKHFALPKKKLSYARIAIITGLHTKEVRNLVNNPNLENRGRPNRAVRVMNGWASDVDFLDERGCPNPLCLHDIEKGFNSLVKRYSGDISPRAILDELLRLDAVHLSNSGTVYYQFEVRPPALSFVAG